MTLMSSEKMPRLWWTLILPKHYWEGPQMLLEINQIDENNVEESDTLYEKRCRKIALDNYTSNPHIVDELFVKMVKSFTEAFFWTTVP